MHFANPAHLDHDALLIAGHAAGDLTATQLPAATTLLATCTDCNALHRDLVAISAATRALPRERPAPRDFRLSADQAASLRRGSWVRSILRPFATAHSATRPIAAAFTSLGVAGLLVAVLVPGLMGGMAASAPAIERQNQSAAGAPAPAPTAAPAADSLSPAIAGPNAPAASADRNKADFATQDPGFQALGGTSSGPQTGSGEAAVGAAGEDASDDSSERLSVATSPTSLLVVSSLGLLLVGLLIFGLRVVARRVR